MKDLCITPLQHEMRAAPAWAAHMSGGEITAEFEP